MSEAGKRRRGWANVFRRLASNHPADSYEHRRLQMKAQRMEGLARHADKQSASQLQGAAASEPPKRLM